MSESFTACEPARHTGMNAAGRASQQKQQKGESDCMMLKGIRSLSAALVLDSCIIHACAVCSCHLDIEGNDVTKSRKEESKRDRRSVTVKQ